MKHGLQCRCGMLVGLVEVTGSESHCLCYCRDCQAFAHFLGDAAAILDERGGSEIVQTVPSSIEFTQGRDQLACIRLTGKGLLRWYARCCNTPIANTPANYKLSFAGIVHSCLVGGRASVENSFGPIDMCVHTRSARGRDRLAQKGVLKGIVAILRTLAVARVTGRYRRTPFFAWRDGKPVVVPQVLSAERRTEIMRAL
ncbi:MAG: DUF6151 family protein [Pseudomonadota bacterium]